jgi:predicted nucleic acid-binding protein
LAVYDASILVNALTSIGRAGDLARAELRAATALEVPAIFGAEAISALRSLAQRGQLSALRASAAVTQVKTIRTIQYPFEPFCDRVWQLRDNLTVYDAWYVALAEWLGTSLVTADRALSAATGPLCPVRHVA